MSIKIKKIRFTSLRCTRCRQRRTRRFNWAGYVIHKYKFLYAKITSIVLIMLFLSGCNLFEWPVYIIFGQKHTKVKAQYTHLQNQTTAIIVAAGAGIEFEYPYARTNIALATAQMIAKHLEGAQFVNQEEVENFQMENLDWAAMPMIDIAKQLGAEQILYLDIFRFTMYQENSVQLLRGRISAAVRVYDVSAGEKPHSTIARAFFDQPAYRSEITLVEPEYGPIPASNAALERLKMKTIIKFADQLAKKFYDHKVPTK